MKKFLSLVLALVMAMSLVTVSAGAKDFDDSDKLSGEQYEEAVNVMSEMGIIDGYADGSFQPQGTLTRGAAAKIIACMMLGKTTAEALGTQAAPFKDVPVGSTFAGYIAYCVETGIIDGYSDGTFRPSNTLTGFAFLKMLLTALGYDSAIEGYANNPNWTVNVAGRAKQIGLVDGNEDFVGTQPATREEACLYALNALQATLVEYTDKGFDFTVGDTTISTGASNATYVTSNVYDAATSINSYTDNEKNGWTVEFAEKYQPKLRLTPDTDDFMRPAHTWSWDKKDIGTYVDYDKMVAEYTEAVTGKDAYDVLSATTIKECDLYSYVDGAEGTIEEADLARNNKDDLDDTDNGVLTQIFVDRDNDEIIITSINTWLAQAYGDYSESKEYAPLKVFAAVDGKVSNYNVDVEDVPAVADVTDESFYLVNISKKDVAAGEVVAIADVEVMEDSTVTKWSKSSSKVVSKVTVDGTEYSAAAKAFYDDDTLEEYDADLLTDMSYNVYLDQYGYVIGVSVYEGDMKYVFITGYDRPKSNLAVSTATAGAIFLDGTMEEIKVNVKDTNANIAASDKAYAGETEKWTYGANNNDGDPILNRWYSYSVNEAGVYTLKPANMVVVYEDEARTIDTANVSIKDNVGDNGTRVYGEDASVFVTVDTDIVDTNTYKEAITDVEGVYTGVQSVDLEIDNDDFVGTVEGHIYAVYDKDYYIIGAIALADATGSTANYAYILDKEAKNEEIKDGVYYWTFDAFMGGEIQTLTAKSKYSSIFNTIKANQYEVLELRFDADGYVVKVIEPTDIYTIYNEEAPGYVSLDECDMYAILKGSDYEADQLTLQGRTLYVTADRADEGLALASDAKALVIQPENGKANVETEFSSVSAALSYLADPNPSTSDLEYDGDIVAVLNSNGTAAWVVFKSNTELKTGSGSGSGSSTSGDSYTANAWSDVFGFAHAVINYERPAYVPANDDVEISFDVFANGKLIDSVGPVAMGAGVDRYTYGAGLGDGAAVPEGATVTVGNVKFYPTEMKVQYKLNGKVLTAAEVAAKLDASYPTTLTTDKDGGAEFKFVPADEAFEAGQYTYAITGVSVVDSKNPALTGTGTVGTGTTINANEIYATGKDYVTVSITATEKAVEYDVDLSAVYTTVDLEDYNATITGSDYNTDKDLTLLVTSPAAPSSGTGDVVTGTPVDFTVTLSGDPTDADAYRVVIKKLGIDGYVYKGNLTLTKRVTVTSDITIDVTDVVVTPVALPEIKSITWTADSVTINFTKAVVIEADAFVEGTFASSATLDEAVTGESVTVTSITYKVANGKLADGDTLTLDTDKITGSVYGGKLKAEGTTITLRDNDAGYEIA